MGPAGIGGPMRGWEWGGLAVAGALFTGLHLRALDAVPLAQFGQVGAEFIPHVQRQLAADLLAERGPVALLHPFELLRALDGHYGGLLHVIAAGWAQLGPDPAAGEAAFAHASHLMLPFLWILVGTTALLARSLGGSLTAGIWLLLFPGVFAAARHYYYDVPMTTCVVVAAWCLLGRPGAPGMGRSLGAGVASATALLFKWAAAPYLAPIWGWAALRAVATGRRPMATLALGAALTVALIAPLATVPGGSFAFQLGLADGDPLPADRAFRMAPLLTSLSRDGLGPLLTPLVVLAALYTVSSIRTHRATSLGVLATAAAPLCILAAAEVTFNGRYLLPILPWLALLPALALPPLFEAAPRLGAAVLTLSLGFGALQVVAVDGLVNPFDAPTRRARIAALPPWRPWWWTGAGLDLPSPSATIHAQVEATLRHSPRTIAWLGGPPASMASHGWSYWLEVCSPHASLMALDPTDPDAPWALQEADALVYFPPLPPSLQSAAEARLPHDEPLPAGPLHLRFREPGP